MIISFRLNELNRADPERININLLKPEQFQNENQFADKAQSFFLGLFLFLAVFNLVMGLVTGWTIYFKYSIYIFCSLLYFAYYFGWLQNVFPSLNHLSLNLVYTWYSIIFITYFIFLNDFGNYREYVPKAHRLLNIGIGFKCIETTLNTMLHYLNVEFIYSTLYFNLIIAFEIVLMSLIVFYIVKNRNIRGKLVIFASLFLIAGAIIEQLKLIHGYDNTYFIELGITLELLTFSVGLGYLTKLYYDEKREAEQKHIQQLIQNQQLQKEINEKLESKVQQRTRELKLEKALVEKKNSENELLLTEIHHRVKNNLQVISSLLSLQERSIDNESARQAIHESKERISSMELVHKMLYHSNRYGEIELKEYIKTIGNGMIASFGLPREQVKLNLDFNQLFLDLDTVIPFGLILNELLLNSFKYARVQDQALILDIKVEIKDSHRFYFSYKDNGNGDAEQIQKSNSFGFKIIRALVHQLDGKMEINQNHGLQYKFELKCSNRTALWK
ncbi:MAG TPA: histidine kinase dimerization/phosphoacceptor domain -containing protein [Bacteroidia bacterium]|nr:histidine kinase dimerization/phosphoacceptor domain -containing protein [Bacteroidia bacterium]